MKYKYTLPARIYKWNNTIVSKEKFIKLAKANWNKKQLESQLIF